jgi:hypothetical protein
MLRHAAVQVMFVRCSYAAHCHAYACGTCQLLVLAAGTRAETGFRLSVKQRSPRDLTGATVQSTTRSRGVRVRW